MLLDLLEPPWCWARVLSQTGCWGRVLTNSRVLGEGAGGASELRVLGQGAGRSNGVLESGAGNDLSTLLQHPTL